MKHIRGAFKQVVDMSQCTWDDVLARFPDHGADEVSS